MQGTDDLQKLLDHVSGRVSINQDFRLHLESLSPLNRAYDLKRIAEEIEVDPEVVDNFDLAGIEEDSLQAFLAEARSRFFEEPSLGPER